MAVPLRDELAKEAPMPGRQFRTWSIGPVFGDDLLLIVEVGRVIDYRLRLCPICFGGIQNRERRPKLRSGRQCKRRNQAPLRTDAFLDYAAALERLPMVRIGHLAG